MTFKIIYYKVYSFLSNNTNNFKIIIYIFMYNSFILLSNIKYLEINLKYFLI